MFCYSTFALKRLCDIGNSCIVSYLAGTQLLLLQICAQNAPKLIFGKWQYRVSAVDPAGKLISLPILSSRLEEGEKWGEKNRGWTGKGGSLHHLHKGMGVTLNFGWVKYR